jgi:hypothetical protein
MRMQCALQNTKAWSEYCFGMEKCTKFVVPGRIASACSFRAVMSSSPNSEMIIGGSVVMVLSVVFLGVYMWKVNRLSCNGCIPFSGNAEEREFLRSSALQESGSIAHGPASTNHSFGEAELEKT